MDLTTEMTAELTTMDMNSTGVMVEELLPRITYSSLWELVVASVYLVASTFWVCGAHSLIIARVAQDATLHTPYNVIIATCSTQDITINIACNVMALYMMVRGGLPVARGAAALHGTTGVASFFAMCYIIAAMAFERYRYFVHPLTHTTLFSPARLGAILGFAVGIPYTYSIITEILIGRVCHESILACHLPGTVYLNYVQLASFLFPSLGVTIYCMIRIWRVAMAQRVAPIEPGNAQAADANVSQLEKIRVALKAIGLVSGTFWGTYIPGFILRTIIFSAGITWYDIDTRKEMGASVMLRVSQLMFIQVSSAVNPLIYYNTNRPMKISICKALGWTFNDPEKEETKRQG